MKFKSGVIKTITSSLLCFSFGTMFTSLAVTSVGKFAAPSGKGGLETTSMPVYLENYSDFMAVADDFPIDPNLDPDYLPEIEILEENLVFQDNDDESFFMDEGSGFPRFFDPEELFAENNPVFNVTETVDNENSVITFNLFGSDEPAPAEELTETAEVVEAVIEEEDRIEVAEEYFEEDYFTEDFYEYEIPSKVAAELAVRDVDTEIFEDVEITVPVTTTEEQLVFVDTEDEVVTEKVEVAEVIEAVEETAVEVTEVVTEVIDENGELAVTELAEAPAEPDSLVIVKTNSIDEFYAGLKSKPNEEIKIPTSPELTYQIYRVRVGDTIGAISQKYGLDNDTLFSVNEIKNTRSLKIGSYLKIPSMKGLLYTVRSKGMTSASIAKKFNVDGEKCARINQVSLNDEYAVGTTIFVPDAKLDNDTRSEIEGVLWKRPLRGKYYVSSPYGWRTSPFNTGKRTFHTGIDLAISSGTPIYAASTGTVISVGYNAVYGNYVKIQHVGGYQTLYAHMSSIAAKKGQFVDTYTIIGRVGSTGQSTGPHLHFTMFKNGVTVSPSSTGLYF